MSLTKISLTGSVDTIKTGFTRVNDIIDDLAAVTTGLGASTIGVFDTAGNMAATDVEAALAEVYTDVVDARALADIFANNPDTTTGLTWGYKAGTIRVDQTVTAVAASTISLTDTATNYIEVNSAGTVSRNTTAFTSGRVPLYTVVCAGGVQTVVTNKRAWFQPLPVPATNGQVLVGSTGADPVLATLTATANETTVANTAGAITVGIADDVIIPTSITIPNEGLHILDTNASHDLIIKAGSDLTADRIFSIITGDAARSLTTDQNIDLSTTAYPRFLGLNNGTFNIAIPTNGFGAASKFMMGDSNTIAWFYLNAAPPGWKVTATGADTVLGVSGGANAYNANGGTAGGTWTQPNHTHTGPSHTHTGPSHTHNLQGTGVALENINKGVEVCIDTDNTIWTNGGAGTYDLLKYLSHIPVAGGTGASGAEGTGATGNGATAATWRPTASIGKLFVLDTA